MRGLKAAFQANRIVAMYNDVARLSQAKGWAWPSYPTVMRRFNALPLAERIALRNGRDEAHRRLYQSQLRDFTGLKGMEWVVLDGRTVDVWVSWSDGSIVCPTVLGLVDQASGKVLDIEIARSENAEALAALERRVFGRFGAPDNLFTDNGAAFSGHIHAGQVSHKHRNKGKREDIADDRLGVFKPMFAEMGQSARRHPDELIFDLLKSGFTTACFDGQNFFDADHPISDDAGNVASVSNVQDGVGPSWFLLDTSRAVRPIIWQEREKYEFQQLVRDDEERVFLNDEYLYGVRARVNAGFGQWQLPEPIVPLPEGLQRDRPAERSRAGAQPQPDADSSCQRRGCDAGR